MYRAVTRNIEVVVTPRFVADRSSPDNNYFFWAYTVAITNHSDDTVQLKTRHWRITDATGRRQEVRGAGVVGEEPVLKAGESFEYTSGVPLQTPSGFMVGTYGMVTAPAASISTSTFPPFRSIAATASARSTKRGGLKRVSLLDAKDLRHDPEKACPGLDPGWRPAFRKDHASPEG